jgi:hypothetical protein
MYHPFAFNKQDIRIISTPSITSASIDFLVVGGGGAGGFRTGGGGGAGGYITSQGGNGGNQLTLSPFTASMGVAYQISIGAGATAFNTDAPSLDTTGKGSDSRFDVYYAEGGGRGGSGYNGTSDVTSYRNGQSGGSGGGGGSWQYSANYVTGSGGIGSMVYGGPYGYNGGSGSISSNSTFRRGGGGGGAAAVGQTALVGNTSNVVGADGGAGLNSGPEETPTYRAGGGGGGASIFPGTPTTASYGGSGGGGNGGTSGFLAGNGTDFTGGGGGGGASGIGGKGGKGVIILKYDSNQITASVTVGVTTSEQLSGNYKLLTVTGGAPGDTITFTPI